MTLLKCQIQEKLCTCTIFMSHFDKLFGGFSELKHLLKYQIKQQKTQEKNLFVVLLFYLICKCKESVANSCGQFCELCIALSHDLQSSSAYTQLYLSLHPFLFERPYEYRRGQNFCSSVWIFV